MTNLLASLNIKGERILLFGYSNLALLRINSILEAGAYPILVVQDDDKTLDAIEQYDLNSKVEIIVDSNYKDNIENYLTLYGNKESDGVIDRVFVTLLKNSHQEIRERIYKSCRKYRVPINTTDYPDLCTFTLLSTHTQGDFQLGITTNGKGCKLSSRLKREIVKNLPSDIDQICTNIGNLRTTIQKEDQISELTTGENEDDLHNSKNFNSLVKEFDQTKNDIKLRRNRWLSQIVEYYPLSKLSSISIEDLKQVYNEDKSKSQPLTESTTTTNKGKIALIGSGPGSVSLLTIGALQAINQADLILADKLVPQQVLDLIPKNHGPELFIARKFPGNAEKAQEELLSMGLVGLKQGKFVIRLKQGDPYIFGRGGEEFNFFEEHGYTPIVVPGISSALAAPVVANIPMTHRDVADQVLICTGTGRKGVVPNLPHFDPNRTTIFLMALHRIVELVPVLIEKGWESDLPVAIIERASCPDQRVIRTTLSKLGDVVEQCGSRPPGLLVTGYACEVIYKDKDFKDFIVEEGFNYDFDTSNISVI